MATKNDAKVKGLRLLTIRDRSRAELEERLRRDFSEQETQEALDYFVEIGYLDDLRYAQNYVRYRNRQRPTGNYLLRIELGRKGIADSYIEQVLNSPETEYELASTLGKQRLGRLLREDSLGRVRKLYGLLQRRGFPASVAKRVVGELLDSDPENEYN